MNIEFNCANCGAGLKVLGAFAGKTIQCPKCTKKTLVPASAEAEQTPVAPKAAPAVKPAAAPAPAAPKAAAESKPPVMDGVYVSFACANCASALKVSKSFAGKSIQCPKCAKKTPVPGGSPKEEPGPAAPIAAPVAAPAPEARPEAVAAPVLPAEKPPTPAAVPPPAAVKAAPAPKPAPKPEPVAAPSPVPAVVAPSAPVPAADELQPRLKEQEQKLEGLMRQMREMELRLDIERLKAEKAEQEKQALASVKAEERLRLQEELSVHFKAEMDAARQTITRLEDKVRAATEQRLVSPPAGTRSAAQIEKELLENPDEAMMEAETAVPDAVMAQIRDSRFGRYLRTSIILHLILLALTSVGLIRGYFVKAPPPGEGGETNNVTVVSAEAPAPVSEAPAVTPAAPVEKPAAATPAANPVEEMPAAGEKPPVESQVDLGL